MQELQISRGKLSVRRMVQELLPGELFVDYSRGAPYDTKTNSYELFVGTKEDGPIKIGGQGVLSFIGKIEGKDLPEKPVAGGIYYVTQDIELNDKKDPSGVNRPEFRAGDLAIYIGELDKTDKSGIDNSVYRALGIFDETAPGWIRIGNGGGYAYQVIFDNNNTNYTATNVQEALVEADRNKLAYGGVKFGKNLTVGSKDLHGQDVILTDAAEDTKLNLSEIFGKISAGYYYSVGELARNKNLVIYLTNDKDDESNSSEKLVLNEGDFIAVTSKVTSNDEPLTESDIIVTKISGGTHDAARIYVDADDLERNDSFKKSSEKRDDALNADAAVNSVQEALADLFKTKADLNDQGKILLSQLPDTLVQSMEFCGSFGSGMGKITNSETGAIEVKPFSLPTAKDKHNDDTSTSEEGTKIVQGDYFIYAGGQVDLKDYSSLSIGSTEGFINPGDWLVYNGSGATPEWSVIDNTSPIKSIIVRDDFHEGGVNDDKLDQSTMDGDVKFFGSKREIGNETTGEKHEITQVELETNHGDTIIIHVDHAALIEAEEAVGTIYKEDGGRSLVKTGLSENNDIFRIEEKDGIVITGREVELEEGEKVALKDVKLIQNEAQTKEIEIKLPRGSGTLARLEDTGLTEGKNFYIPRFRKDTDGNIALTASPIELVEHTELGDSQNVRGFIFHGDRTAGSTFKSDAAIIFQNNDKWNSVVQVMPKESGIILNTNSIIDCGEWDDDGVHFENEGAQNVYFGGKQLGMESTSIQTKEYIEYISGLKDEDGVEGIDAFIGEGSGSN